MDKKSGIRRAVEMFDNSPSKLAAALGNYVLRQHVEHWLTAGRVPAERTPDIAALTEIPEEEFNDKTNWSLVRMRNKKNRDQRDSSKLPTPKAQPEH